MEVSGHPYLLLKIIMVNAHNQTRQLQYWVVWYNLVSFTLGVAGNVSIKVAKQKALAAKEKKEREEGGETESDSRRV